MCAFGFGSARGGWQRAVQQVYSCIGAEEDSANRAKAVGRGQGKCVEQQKPRAITQRKHETMRDTAAAADADAEQTRVSSSPCCGT